MNRVVGMACLAAAFTWAMASEPMAVPAPAASSPALAELGRKLFFDTRLSADGKTSCASCHQPDKAFQDGLAKARGAFGQVGTRNTPSLLHVGLQQTLFWDGRRSRLSEQAIDPLLNPREHALGSESQLESRLAGLQDYAPLVSAATDRRSQEQPRLTALIGQALAAFEQTLSDGESAFERFKYRGDDSALSPAAKRGWLLFSGRAQCTGCHQVGNTAPVLLTDHGFHALPAQRTASALGDLVNRFEALMHAGQAPDRVLLSDDELAALGRFVVTEDPLDIGAFKTPSLRNVALTAPYMHDGSVATLQEAVELEIYYRSTQDGRPLILTDDEKSDLVAFLNALTSYRPPR